MKLSLCSKTPAAQGGAALLIALLIVTVVAAFGVRFATDYQLSVARAESRWHGAQARSYLEGAERLAAYLLQEDDPEVDSLMSPWAEELPPFDIEGGWLHARIEDARGRLNLNDLLSYLDPELAHMDPNRFTAAQRRFIRLLQSFPEEAPISEDEAVAILEAVVDWMDPDDEVTGFGGAESGYYQSLDPPLLPANTYFSSVEELQLVRHMTPELMALLRPYLIALPPDQGMNLNTMPPLLLGTLNTAEHLQPLEPMAVEMLLQEWPLEGYYMSVTEFAENPAWGSILATGTSNLDVEGLTINTNYFKVLTQVSLVDQRRSMESLLLRDPQRIQVIQRSDVY